MQKQEQEMREYKYVSAEDRTALLHLVKVCDVTIKCAAQRLSIKYDAAKAIFRKDRIDRAAQSQR